MGFPLVLKLITSNGLMAIILCHLTELGSFRANYIAVVEGRAILSMTKCSPAIYDS